MKNWIVKTAILLGVLFTAIGCSALSGAAWANFPARPEGVLLTGAIAIGMSVFESRRAAIGFARLYREEEGADLLDEPLLLQDAPDEDAHRRDEEGEDEGAPRNGPGIDRENDFAGEAMREVQAAGYPLSLVLSGTPGSLNDAQRQALQTVQAALRRLTQAAEKTVPSESLTLRS